MNVMEGLQLEGGRRNCTLKIRILVKTKQSLCFLKIVSKASKVQSESSQISSEMSEDSEMGLSGQS